MARQKGQSQAESSKETSANTNYFNTERGGRGWLYALTALIVLIMVFIAGVSAANFRRGWEHDNFTKSGLMGNDFGSRHMLGGHMGLINSQNSYRGVVTNVNGNNFTIAGNGSTTNVTIDSSTSYRGGNQVKQNDTVIVFGTNTNGTITASQIVINP